MVWTTCCCMTDVLQSLLQSKFNWSKNEITSEYRIKIGLRFGSLDISASTLPWSLKLCCHTFIYGHRHLLFAHNIWFHFKACNVREIFSSVIWLAMFLFLCTLTSRKFWVCNIHIIKNIITMIFQKNAFHFNVSFTLIHGECENKYICFQTGAIVHQKYIYIYI